MKKKNRTKAKRSKPRKQAISNDSELNLILPYKKIGRLLREKIPNLKISDDSSVYIASIMEYLIAEIMDLAANEISTKKQKKLITPK